MSIKLPTPLATSMAPALLHQEKNLPSWRWIFGKWTNPCIPKFALNLYQNNLSFWSVHLWPKSCSPMSLSPLLKDYTNGDGTSSSEKHLCALAAFPSRLSPGGKNNPRSRLSSSKRNHWRMRQLLSWSNFPQVFPLMLMLPELYALGYAERSWHMKEQNQYQTKP